MAWMEIPLVTLLAAGAGTFTPLAGQPDRCPSTAVTAPMSSARADDAPLFYRYGEGRSPAFAQRLTLRVFQAEQLVLTEELLAHPQDGTEAVVELLARHPDELARLEQLSRTQKLRVELEHAGGTQSMGWAELREASRQLTAGPWLPQRTSGAVRFATDRDGAPQRIPCDDCYINYDNCIATCEGLPICERRCERQLNNCLANCSCEPTSQTVVESEVAGSRYLGWACMRLWPEPTGYERDVLEITIKHTRKRITYNCDGTQTVEILEVWYSTQYCVVRQAFWSCSFPTDWFGCTL